jgi:predicted esterase
MEASENSLKITRTARYYQLGECGSDTQRLWITLHGYGQLASYFIKHFEPQANAHTCIVAPEGLSRFYLDGKWDRVGATWMTKEDRLHEIEDYLGYLDSLLLQLAPAPETEIVVLGFSQGTATAWRWVMQGNVRPAHLILWAGGPATDAMHRASERLQNCTLDIALGDSDEYIKLPDAEKQLAAMQQFKPGAQLWPFIGNHRMDAATLQRIVEHW